jgi:serine/threonine protein kinase
MHAIYPPNSQAGPYVLHSLIGDGTYGQVYRASKFNDPSQRYAIKLVKLEEEKNGFPLTAIREIKILRVLSKFREDETYCVKLHDVIADRTHTLLVFEMLDFDLSGYLNAHRDLRTDIPLPHIKHIALQLLKGIHFMHDHGIVHRDIKAANILMRRDSRVAIADFGLARYLPSVLAAENPALPTGTGTNTTNSSSTSSQFSQYSMDEDPSRYKAAVKPYMTAGVVTRWYRAPELLYGYAHYSAPVDVWSIACVLVELFNRGVPLFQGDDDRRQLEDILRTTGTPSDRDWPWLMQVRQMGPESKERRMFDANAPKHVFTSNTLRLRLEENNVRDKLCVDLLEKMLAVVPDKRWTAEQCLQHPWFTTQPLPRAFVAEHAGRFELQGRLERREQSMQQQQQHQQHQQHHSHQQPHHQHPGGHPSHEPRVFGRRQLNRPPMPSGPAPPMPMQANRKRDRPDDM